MNDTIIINNKSDETRHNFIHMIAVGAKGSQEDLESLCLSLNAQITNKYEDLIRMTIVVNDASLSVEHLIREYPWVNGQSSDQNNGYGSAINFAYQSLPVPKPAWIVICNADLEFPDDSLENMVEAARDASPDTGCIAPRLYDPDFMGGKVQPSVGEFPTLASLLFGKLQPRSTRKYKRVPSAANSNVDWATGACLMLRSSAFASIGLFDEGIFLDYEETDLCRRLADANWRRIYNPAWEVIHKNPNAYKPVNPARQIHTRASMVRYLAKHRPAWELHTMGMLLNTTVLIRNKDHPLAASWRSGLAEYRKHIELRKPTHK